MKLFLAGILFLIAAQQPAFVEGKNFRGYIFDEDHFVMVSIGYQKGRYTPVPEDVLLAEKLVLKQLKVLNHQKINQHDSCPVVHKKLRKYIRQYVGYKNNNDEKVIWINFLWDEAKFVGRVDKDIIHVSDGCSRYWSVKVNLETGKLYDLRINGSG